MSASTAVTLSLTTGTGTLAGTLTGTIPATQSQVTFTGVTYTKAQSGVVLTATRTSGDSLTPGASALFTVNPASVSAASSTVAASPSLVTADGVTIATITVTLLDANSNPVSGKTVTLASSRGGTDTISGASGPSDANGVVTFTVTSTTVGSAVLSATDADDSLLITQTAIVAFTTLVFGEEQYQPDGADPDPIGVIGGDLLETSVASVTGEPASIDGGSSLPHLRDGTFGDYVAYNDSSEYTTTYALDTTSNPFGYDINEIRLFSNGGSRTSQAYDLKYSLVEAPDTFLFLGTYTGTLPGGANGTLMTRTYDNRAATPDAGPAILTGVAAIQFVIRPNGLGTLYREWDVTGSATPTPPASILSFGIPGSVGVIRGTNIALTVPWNPYGTALATLAPTFTLSSGTCNQTSGSPPSPNFAVQNPANYSVTEGATVNNYTVTVTVTPASTNKVMSNVFFEGLGYAFVNNTPGTNFALLVTNRTPVTALTPTFEVSQFATASPASGTTRDFTTPQTYVVTAENGSKQTNTVTVLYLPGYVGYEAMVLGSGAIAYWPLNEMSGTVAQDIAGPNNATNTGTYTLYQTGLRAVGVGRSVLYNGGQAATPYSANLNPNQFTVEFWCMPENLNVAYVVAFQDRTGSENRSGWAVQKNNFTSGWDFTYGIIAGTGNHTISSGTPVVAGQLYYVVATHDGTTASLYVNGVLVNSQADTYRPASASQPGLSIGARNDVSYVNGYLQDVALYGRALSAQEILTHFQNPPFLRVTTVADGKLQLYWFPDGGTLEESSIVTGPYNPVGFQTWPYTNTPSLSKDFWRVQE